MLKMTESRVWTKLTEDYANVVPNLVFSTSGADVDTVLINGNVVMENRKLMTADEQELFKKATETTKSLIIRRQPFVPDAPTIDDIEL